MGSKIVLIVVAVVLLGAGFMLGGQMGSESTAAADVEGEEAEPAEKEVHVGIIVDLDAVNINLADSRYLRVAISLGLDHEIVLDDGHGHVTEFKTAAASDVLLRTLTGRTITELSSSEGREAMREQLLVGMEEHYGHDVVAVYFTEFVMQ